MRPASHSKGHDTLRLIDQLVPGVAAVIDDVRVGGEDAVGQPIIPHELRDVFLRVELGAFGRQGHDGDVLRQRQFRCHMPSSLIHQQHRMSARSDGLGNFREMQIRRRRIAEGQDETRGLALFWADRSKDVGRSRSLIMGRGRSRARSTRSAARASPRSHAS
jgi:hypothetical protein